MHVLITVIITNNCILNNSYNDVNYNINYDNNNYSDICWMNHFEVIPVISFLGVDIVTVVVWMPN